MDYSTYVAKTMITAMTKIGPVIAFIVMGYFIFIKLPFLIFRNSLRSNRGYDMEPIRVREEFKENYSVNDYEKFLKRQARLEEKKEEPKQKAREEKKEEPKEERKQERRKEERKAAPKQEKPSTGISPEESLFRFEAGQRFTKDELKKRYRDLLKQSHPDKVSSMGDDFKKMAEMKTKEINAAYERLKNKAA